MLCRSLLLQYKSVEYDKQMCSGYPSCFLHRAYRFNPVMIKTSVNHNQGNCIKRNVRTVQGGRGLEQQLDP